PDTNEIPPVPAGALVGAPAAPPAPAGLAVPQLATSPAASARGVARRAAVARRPSIGSSLATQRALPTLDLWGRGRRARHAGGGAAGGCGGCEGVLVLEHSFAGGPPQPEAAPPPAWLTRMGGGARTRRDERAWRIRGSRNRVPRLAWGSSYPRSTRPSLRLGGRDPARKEGPGPSKSQTGHARSRKESRDYEGCIAVADTVARAGATPGRGLARHRGPGRRERVLDAPRRAPHAPHHLDRGGEAHAELGQQDRPPPRRRQLPVDGRQAGDPRRRHPRPHHRPAQPGVRRHERRPVAFEHAAEHVDPAVPHRVDA